MMRQSRIGVNIVKVLLVVASVLLVGVCVLSMKRFDAFEPRLRRLINRRYGLPCLATETTLELWFRG